MRKTLFGLCVICSACWKPPFSDMPTISTQFDPRSGDSFEGWTVEVHNMPFTCPDGEEGTITLIRPDIEIGASSTTLLFHSATFDFNYEVDGEWVGYRDQNSLTRDWALRRVHTTIGHYVDDVTEDQLTGAIAQALVEQGTQLVVPGNCWGDMWHNRYNAGFENDTEADGFSRSGGDAAKWAYDLVTQVGFGAESGIENSDLLVTEAVYGVGLGEGGRAIGELEVMGRHFQGAIMDSTPDNLNYYVVNESAYPKINIGLNRIFPEGSDIGAASVANVPRLPNRVAYIYSSIDEHTPFQLHNNAITVFSNSDSHWVKDLNEKGHNTSGSNLNTARLAVAHMMDIPSSQE